MYLVQKYGGSYLKNNEDLAKIADHIATHREELGDLVVVTAAMHEIANEMMERAEQFELLGELKVNLNVIAQQPYLDGTCVVSFSCDGSDIERIDNALAINARFKDLKTEKRLDICMISVVGVGMATHVGVAGKVFATLAEAGIPHYNVTTSEISISTTIGAYNKAEAVVALAEA
ncbi:MAG: ACT domain-containing protein, partial [Bacillota bacterium]